jgi:hypothetical protein
MPRASDVADLVATASVEAPERLNLGDKGVIQVSRGVPEHVSSGSGNQDGTVADADTRRDLDAVKIGFQLGDGGGVILLECIQGGPLLAVWRKVLPFVIADGTDGGWFGSVRVFEAAGGAEPEGHWISFVGWGWNA